MKTNHHTTLFAIALAIFMLFLAGPAFPQDKPADTMQIVREKVRADKKLFIAEYMKLTESEANAFWPVYDAYQKELSKLGDRFLTMVKEYAKKHSTMSNEEAKKMLDDHLTFEEDYIKIMKSYMPKFNDVLPWKRVAQYYQLENKIKSVTNYGIAARIPLIP
jgi:hypothetical protein